MVHRKIFGKLGRFMIATALSALVAAQALAAQINMHFFDSLNNPIADPSKISLRIIDASGNIIQDGLTPTASDFTWTAPYPDAYTIIATYTESATINGNTVNASVVTSRDITIQTDSDILERNFYFRSPFAQNVTLRLRNIPQDGSWTSADVILSPVNTSRTFTDATSLTFTITDLTNPETVIPVLPRMAYNITVQNQDGSQQKTIGREFYARDYGVLYVDYGYESIPSMNIHIYLSDDQRNTVNFDGTESITVELYDTSGNLITSQAVTATAGSNVTDVSLQPQKGSYVLKVRVSKNGIERVRERTVNFYSTRDYNFYMYAFVSKNIIFKVLDGRSGQPLNGIITITNPDGSTQDIACNGQCNANLIWRATYQIKTSVAGYNDSIRTLTVYGDGVREINMY